MTIDYQPEPFNRVSPRLRNWFGQIVERIEAEDAFPLWRVILPPGSSVDDAIAVSDCLRVLFPHRVAAQAHTPVDVEFTL